MEYDDFVFRKLLKELSGQVIYQIKEDSSTIDFKFIKDGNNNEIVTYFRFDKYIENPNSVEVNLREYIDNNYIYWVSRQKILYFMIDQMRNLFGSSYFYNIDVFGKLVEVTISLKDYELEGFNIFGRIISEKNKDYETILKFLPIWEVVQCKRSINNNNCVICLSEFQIGEKIAALPCLHIFHYDCIKSWLKTDLICPVCKFEVTLKSIIGENNY